MVLDYNNSQMEIELGCRKTNIIILATTKTERQIQFFFLDRN